MKSFIKRIILMLQIIIVIFSFAACGQNMANKKESYYEIITVSETELPTFYVNRVIDINDLFIKEIGVTYSAEVFYNDGFFKENLTVSNDFTFIPVKECVVFVRIIGTYPDGMKGTGEINLTIEGL